MKLAAAILAVLGSASVLPAAQAQDAGDWLWRVGIHNVRPKSDNHGIVNVRTGSSLTFNGTYFVAPNWGVELLAALPFEHDVKLNGGGKVAKTKHLPPTLSLQYHFNPNGAWRPYAGLGLNYTLFFDEKTRGVLAGSKLELDPSWGLAAQLGVDVQLGGNWFVNADARWMDIDTDAKLDGANIGTIEIDPYAFGLSVGRRF
ncbi:MAG TPA: OmpW family outer membrane protein [Steroidobacter sp.]|uniref:OmpW/AlkL family protein n=1 Tax=Steroidobacter sp. TaxID=1978227 RepID=UPI002ED96A91